MNTERPQPPAFAMWLLNHLCPKRTREVLTGDLLESFEEGRSNRWFWRQVLAAILVGASSQCRLLRSEICLSAAGTLLIWSIPWGVIFPTSAITPSANVATQLSVLAIIEMMTALILLPLFAVLFHVRATLSRLNLRRAFFLSAALLTVGDLLTLWWCTAHPAMTPSQATWTVALQLAWISATLLISARATRPAL